MNREKVAQELVKIVKLLTAEASDITKELNDFTDKYAREVGKEAAKAIDSLSKVQQMESTAVVKVLNKMSQQAKQRGDNKGLNNVEWVRQRIREIDDDAKKARDIVLDDVLGGLNSLEM